MDAVPNQLSAAEKHQLDQYLKIIELRDVVLSGKHPRIKIPVRLAGKVPPPHAVVSPVLQQSQHSTSASASESASTPVSASASRPVQVSTSASAFGGPSQANGQVPGAPRSVATPAAGSRSFGAVKPAVEINPILLQKSDDLIRAEFQVRRQRIENGIKEELENKRLTNKSSIHSEPTLNIAEIYQQAQRLVAAADASANAIAASSSPAVDVDSVSDGTFYSSRHDTPESQDDQPMSIDDAASVGEPARQHNQAAPATSAHSAAAVAPATVPASVATQDSTMAQPPTVSSNFPPSYPPSRLSVQHSLYEPHISSLQGTAGISTRPSSRQELDSLAANAENGSSSAARSINDVSPISGQMEIDHFPASTSMQYQRTRRVYDTDYAPSTVVRSHNLVPAAPQPYHVSPLATQNGASKVEATIAPQNDNSGSSAQTSPQDRNNKRKPKSKKRKQDRDYETSEPVIKTEPQSPEPLPAPSHPSTRKRLKSRRNDAPNENNDIPYSPNQAAAPRDTRVTEAYAPFDQDAYHATEELVPDRAYYPPGPSAPRPPQIVRRSYPAYPQAEYGPERRYYDHPTEFESRGVYMEVDPGSGYLNEPEMAVYRPSQTRTIVRVDPYGRHYYRPSQAEHQPHYAEEVIFEQPVRAASRRPVPVGYYEENAYRGASPARVEMAQYAPSRHRQVVSPVNATRPTDDYGHVYLTSRVHEESPRYARHATVRPMSVRPSDAPRRNDSIPYARPASSRPMDPVRYAGPVEGAYQRLTSVRPEGNEAGPPPIVAARHFMPPPPPMPAQRAYSMNPVDRVQRSFSVHPERMYGEEMGYGERQPAPEGNYGEEVYHR